MSQGTLKRTQQRSAGTRQHHSVGARSYSKGNESLFPPSDFYLKRPNRNHSPSPYRNHGRQPRIRLDFQGVNAFCERAFVVIGFLTSGVLIVLMAADLIFAVPFHRASKLFSGWMLFAGFLLLQLTRSVYRDLRRFGPSSVDLRWPNRSSLNG